MFYPRCLALSAALMSLIASTSAYDPTGRTNVAMYFGQGAATYEADLGLSHYCDNDDVDIIPLAFLNAYLAQGDGYGGTNFAASCFAPVFSGPGYNGVVDHTKDQLHSQCNAVVSGIGPCQAKGKKILLSLGGAVGPYQLSSDQEATDLADFLWGAFGPKDTTATWPRPFDLDDVSQEVDGFDFDIEQIRPGEQSFYITLINQLRSHFPSGPGAKQYLITGAPQCIFPDAHMGNIISGVRFDILFVQYYNTDQCSGRNWVTANLNYSTTKQENPSSFKDRFKDLEDNLAGGASRDAKVYFGLPGSAGAVPGHVLDYLDPATELTPFVEAYFCNPRFGGVMIWEAAYAEGNVANGQTFQKRVKEALTCPSLSCPAPSTTSASSSTASSTTSSATSSITAPVCTKTYTVVAGDLCYLIAGNNGLSLADFYALNPGLNDDTCRNLQIGQVVCVSSSPVSSTSSSSATASTTSAPVCTKTYTIVSGNTCAQIASDNGLTLAAFFALNPGLNDNTCRNLQIGQIVCVSSSSATSSTSSSATSTPACTKTYTVTSGNTCSQIASDNGLTLAGFYALNPGLSDATCPNLQIGQVVCVGSGSATSTASSTASSTSSSASATSTPTCTKTYAVVSGNTCSQIATDNGLTLAAFYTLNPGLNDITCPNLQIGQVVCVGSSTSSSTTSSITSSSTSGGSSSVTTSSTATASTSSVPACTKTYAVASGNTCSQIATDNGLTLAAFYGLNPGLSDETCPGLQIGQVVCISSAGTSSTTSSASSTTSSITSSATSSSTPSTSSSITSSGTSSAMSGTTSSSVSGTTSGASSSTTSTSTFGTTSGTASSASISTTASTTSPRVCSSSSTSSGSGSSSSLSSSTSSVYDPASTSSTSMISSPPSTFTTISIRNTQSSSSSFSSFTSFGNSSTSSTGGSATAPLTSTSTSVPVQAASSSSTSTSVPAQVASSSTSAPTTGPVQVASTSASTTTSASIPTTIPVQVASTSYTSTTTSAPVVIPATSQITTTTTTTTTYTITSCPPVVTNCPIGKVTSEVVVITTTYCPASAPPTPVATAPAVQYTTSSVYTTIVYTITACPPTVTNCPAKGSVTTETRFLYSTICPASTTPAAGGPGKAISNPGLVATGPAGAGYSSSFPVVVQTVSVVPIATPTVVPFPTTVPVQVIAASPTSTLRPGFVGGSSGISYQPSAIPVNPNAATFRGGAGGMGGLRSGGVLLVVLGLIGWMMV